MGGRNCLEIRLCWLLLKDLPGLSCHPHSDSLRKVIIPITGMEAREVSRQDPTQLRVFCEDAVVSGDFTEALLPQPVGEDAG